MNKKILDVTCGSRTIWFDKNHPAAIYCDTRDEEYTGVWKSTNQDSERTCIVHPDVVCDFTALPFQDNSFSLVVFDPPHLLRVGENAWMRKKYGKLGENWREMLHDGFHECMRVLKPDGVLIFKWAETQIPAADVWAAIGERPLFGHHSGKKSQTFWGCFMKFGGDNNAECLEDVIADFERLPVEYSARFVPVTRCKDCEYSCCVSGSRYCAHCNYPFADCEVDDNFYCAYGARMER